MGIVVKVEVHAPMDLHMYPFDRHIVPFCLNTREGKLGKQSMWMLPSKCPRWVPAEHAEDKLILSQKQTMPDLEYEHKRCFAYLEGKQKPILFVLLERRPTRVIQRTAVPVFIVVSIALMVSGIKESSFQNEYGAVVTSLFTMTAFSYSVQQSLPKLSTPYLAWADYYFVARFSHTLIPTLCVLDQLRVMAAWLHLPLHDCHQDHHQVATVR